MTSPTVSSRSIAWLALFNVSSWVVLAVYGFITSTVIFRLTGAENFGIWATIMSLRVIVLFFEGGLSIGLTRDAALVSHDHRDAVQRMRAARALYLLLVIVALIVAVIASSIPGWLFGLQGSASARAGAVAVVLFCDAAVALIASPLSASLRGLQRFDILGLAAVAQALIGTVLVIAGAMAGGLLGAALALLVARAATGSGYAVWLWRHGHEIGAITTDRRALRAVARFAAPVWVMALGALVGQGLDIPLVGFFFGSQQAGYYAVGMIPASVLASAIWVLIDTIFPRLAAEGALKPFDTFRLLVFATCFLGAFGFTILASAATPILRAWVGDAPLLAELVMVLYAVIWVFHMPSHVLALAAIARSEHGVLTKLVVVEALANVVLSLALIRPLGPLGPAVATLATLAVSNLLVVPRLLLPRLGVSLSGFLRVTLIGNVGGLVFGLATWAFARVLGGSDVLELLIASVIPVVIVIIGGAVWVTNQRAAYTLAEVLLGRDAAPPAH